MQLAAKAFCRFLPHEEIVFLDQGEKQAKGLYFSLQLEFIL